MQNERIGVFSMGLAREIANRMQAYYVEML